MCGRFTLSAMPRSMLNELDLISPLDAPRYNIAPTQSVFVVVHEYEESPSLEEMRWGLLPYWAQDETLGARHINARAETLDSKPAFREAFKRRRCLVPATGFYEWKRISDKDRTPYYFTPATEGEPLVFAGLWERWRGGGREIRSFTIITMAANEWVAPVHDRMPVVLPKRMWKEWIAPGLVKPGELSAVLAAGSATAFHRWKVGPHVNNPRNEGEECIAAVE